MFKTALWVAVPVAIIWAGIATYRDAIYNPDWPGELLGVFFLARLSVFCLVAVFVIWLLGRVGLAVWRRLRVTPPS